MGNLTSWKSLLVLAAMLGGPASSVAEDGVPRESPAPEIAGKRYLVPPSCDVIPAGEGTLVNCSDGGMLLWEEIAPGATWDAEKAIRFAGPFTEARPDRACWVDGAPTRCQTRATADGSVELHVAGVVTLRGKRIALLCWDVARGAPLPPVCASVLSFEPPRP